MRRRQWRAAVVILALLCAAGCLWRSYGTILGVHLDVLTQTAEKLVSVAQSGRGLTTEGMAEYVYPAKRGREFLRQFRSYSGRRSYQQFGQFLDRYDAFVKNADMARSQGSDGRDIVPTLAAERDALIQIAAAIRRDLEAGD